MADAALQLIYPEYALSMLVAIAIGVLFPVMQDIRLPRHRRQYILLQALTFTSAIIGCKLAVLFGELGWPFLSYHAPVSAILSGRSILGALIFGSIGAEIAKWAIGYPLPPNDRFAAVLPFTLAVGRVGCLLHGCCRGLPHRGWCSITYADGIERYPAQAFELFFHFTAGVIFVWMTMNGMLRGRIFYLYLILYGVFRYLTEFVRETPKTAS